MADIKVIIAEQDGQEFNEYREYILQPQDIPFNAVGFTAGNVYDGIIEAQTGSSPDNFNYWLIDQAVTIPTNQIMNVPFLVFTTGSLTLNGFLRFH